MPTHYAVLCGPMSPSLQGLSSDCLSQRSKWVLCGGSFPSSTDGLPSGRTERKDLTWLFCFGELPRLRFVIIFALVDVAVVK